MKCIFVILIVPAIIPEAVSAWPPADIFSKLISDFQDFHNQNRICLINSAQAHRDEDAKTPDYRSWITRTVSQLAKRSYLSVARAGSAEGFKLTVHARDNGTSPSIQKVCAGLVVAQLTDHNVAAEFSKIFTESLEQDQWLLMINQDMPELLTSLYLPLNNKVTLAMFSEDTTSASLWESYQILRGGTPKLVRVGSWNLGRQSIFEDGSGFETIPRVNVLPMKYLSRRSMRFGQIIAPEGDVAQRRWDLTGLHLRCTVLPDTTTLVIRNRDGTLSLGGVFGNLFNLIQEITNFTSTCHIPVDRKYGSFENGKWTGMVADLVQDRADIAVALLDVTEERVQDIDYLVSIGFSRYMVVMKRPSFSDFQWKTYIQEFHGHVWLLLLLSIVAMILVFYVITALLPIEENISLSESFTLVSGCIVGQGSWLNFRTVGARIAFLTAMISGVLLMAHYTSYLVSALAAGPSLPHYITLNKVYQLGIPTGWTDGTAMSEYIRRRTY
ncbi:uncharacterized protein LOC119592649 isoform X2 [Penaeus monodon]|uniref:uncharacterized protein LOC119592649 isoform X2 n=1 Tax=Penaeus monodon TaxID=6687 RepID=UPI0018A6EBB7|nr:uncharacterized protein LOC119592649 isoform X2 [Penaeus monodon]